MPSPIVSVLYVSRAAPLVGTAEIRAILGTARRRNRQLDLTGALAHADGRFAQVLEGPPEALEQVLASIARDPRHHQLRVIRRVASDRRQFADWDMGYIEGFGANELVERWIEGSTVDEADVETFVARLLNPAL